MAFYDDDEKNDFKEGVSKWAENERDSDERGHKHSFDEDLAVVADSTRYSEDRKEKHTNEENLQQIADNYRDSDLRGRQHSWAENKNAIANKFRDSDRPDTSCDREADGKVINEHFTPRDYNDGYSSGSYSSGGDGIGFFGIVGIIIAVWALIALIVVATGIGNRKPTQSSNPVSVESSHTSQVENLIRSSNSYIVNVIYNEKIEDKLQELGCTYANSNAKSITSQTFPPRENGISIIKIYLVSKYLLAEYTLDEIPAVLDQLGYRPADIQEVIELGLQHKNNFFSNDEGNEIYTFAQESSNNSPTTGKRQYCAIYYTLSSGKIYSIVGYISETTGGCGGKIPPYMFAIVSK